MKFMNYIEQFVGESLNSLILYIKWSLHDTSFSPSVFQTESSHDHTELENDIVFWGTDLSSQSYSEKKRIAIKLQRQFGHPS